MKAVLILGLVVLLALCTTILASIEDDIIIDSSSAPIIGESNPTTPVINVEDIKRKGGEEVNISAEGDAATVAFTETEFKAWPITKLREFVNVRGLVCKGCSEKEDFVKMAFDNQHLPIVDAKPAEATTDAPAPEKREIDKEEMENLMAKLRKGGFGNSNFFSADDFKDLTPDEIAAKMNGGGKGGKPRRTPRSKKSSKKSEKTDDASNASETTKDEDSKKESKKDGKKDKKDKKKASSSNKDTKEDKKKTGSSKSEKEKTSSKKSEKKKEEKKKSNDKEDNFFHRNSGSNSNSKEEKLEEETIEL